MKIATCIHDMMISQKIIIDGNKYLVSDNMIEETTIKYLDSNNNYICAGYIKPVNKRCFKIEHRSKGFLWETRVKYTSVICQN